MEILASFVHEMKSLLRAKSTQWGSLILTVNIIGEITEYSEVRLVNSFGQIMQTVFSNQVPLNDLPGGMYYLQLFEDKVMYTEKVLVVD